MGSGRTFPGLSDGDIVDRAADRYYRNFVQGKLLFRAKLFEFHDGVVWCGVVWGHIRAIRIEVNSTRIDATHDPSILSILIGTNFMLETALAPAVVTARRCDRKSMLPDLRIRRRLRGAERLVLNPLLRFRFVPCDSWMYHEVDRRVAEDVARTEQQERGREQARRSAIGPMSHAIQPFISEATLLSD